MDAFSYAAEIDRKLEALTKDNYLMRKGAAKRLFEEQYPLSRLAVLLKLPGLEVDVEAPVDYGRADGHISIIGFKEETFEVQITFAGYDGDEALRSELLVANGCCPGTGPIRRDKKTKSIIAEGKCQDFDEPIFRLADSILNRFQKKAAHNPPYPPSTYLIVAFYDLALGGRGFWTRLYQAIEQKGGILGQVFRRVYLFNCGTGEIQFVA